MGIMKITEDREHRDLKLYGDGPVTLSINGEAVELTDLGLSISDRNKFSRRSFKNPFVDISLAEKLINPLCNPAFPLWKACY